MRNGASSRPSVEPLETRLAPAGLSYDAGTRVITATGSDGADYVSVDHADGGGVTVSMQCPDGGWHQLTADAVGVTADLGAGDDYFMASGLWDPSRSVGMIVYGEDGNDMIVGGPLDDRLFGGHGSDVLDGQAADDHLDGGYGPDVLHGGDGNDRLYGEDTLSVNNVPADQADELHGGDGYDYLSGGWGDDTLRGDEGNDYLEGYDGNDYLYGGAGEDRLQGNSGHDDLHGGDGNDILHGGIGRDRLWGEGGVDKMESITGLEVESFSQFYGTEFERELSDAHVNDEWILTAE